MFANNKLTKLLNIKYPIIQGGMAGVSEAVLTAAGTYTYSYYAGTGTYCPDPAAVRHWYMLVTRLEKTGSVVSPGVKCVNGTYNYSGTLTVGMVQK